VESRIQVVSIVVMAGVFAVVLELVRRRRLMERYALLWLFAATVLLAMAVWTDLLTWFARTVGVAYAPSALFAAALGFVVMLLLHFSLVISRLADQSKLNAQRLALLQQRVDELERERSMERYERETLER
jgi:hypothetical protein